MRAIVETALSQKAVSVILSHNHVDAYALPSREDEITTRRVRDALLLVGITLADHIIVCGEDYVSFADSGSESSPAAQILHFACQTLFQISRGCERFVLW